MLQVYYELRQKTSSEHGTPSYVYERCFPVNLKKKEEKI